MFFNNVATNAFINHAVSPITRSKSSALSRIDASATIVCSEENTEETQTPEEIRRRRKRELFGLIGTKAPNESANEVRDAILANPVTKEPLMITANGPILGGQSSTGVKVSLVSSTDTFSGSTNSYYNLLSSAAENESDDSGEDQLSTDILNSLKSYVPGPIVAALSSAGILSDDDYIPMRDLFTSPSVSFAYERGWRQGFAAAGFPGADAEYNMVKEYFGPVHPETVVDMSCATGLFTRRLAKGNDYKRVIGCDYSDAMLMEARNRIRSDTTLSSRDPKKTQLDLIRCDVGEIPMITNSVDALHAGAAMHCWPDLHSALSEIYRVLKPGSRFFATTFLATYFRNLQLNDSAKVQQQAFQYFESVQALEDLVLKAGFEKNKVKIEVLGTACVVIRAEK